MAWKTIHDAAGNFLKVYDGSTRGEDVGHWNYTHAAPDATHTAIADKPSDDHVWDDAASKWKVDLAAVRQSKKSELEAEAREAFFQASAESTALDAAKAAVDSASSKTTINSVTLL